MKKILKKISLTSLMLSLTAVGVLNLNAASKYAFSVGTNYVIDNIDTNRNLDWANEKLVAMGYTSYVLRKPTYNELTSKINSNRYKMESEMLLFAGHGNNSSMAWNCMNYGGDYKVGITKDGNNCGLDGVDYIGIGQYDLGKVDFAFFAGCKTAKGNDNITEYAYEQGAKSTLGFQESVKDYDAYWWTRRIYSGFAAGKTLQEVVAWADEFEYIDPATIKSHKYYGNINATYNKVINKKMVADYEKIDSEFNRKSYTYQSEKNMDIEVLIYNKLKEINKEINLDDFILEKANNDDFYIYDYSFTIDGIKTNMVYTVKVSKKDNSIKIIDNTKGKDLYEVKSNKQRELSRLKSKVNTIELDNQYLIKKINDSGYIRELESSFNYYNVVEDKLYHMTAIKVTDIATQTHSVKLYMEEIK